MCVGPHSYNALASRSSVRKISASTRRLRTDQSVGNLALASSSVRENEKRRNSTWQQSKTNLLFIGGLKNFLAKKNPGRKKRRTLLVTSARGTSSRWVRSVA